MPVNGLAVPGSAHRAGRGGEAVAGEGADQGVRAGGRSGARGRELGGIPVLERGDAPLGEPAHGIVARLVGEEAQRLRGEVVVVGLERLVAGVADDVGPRGATASAVAGGGLAARSMRPSVLEVLEVAADGRGGEPQVLGQRAGGDRARAR